MINNRQQSGRRRGRGNNSNQRAQGGGNNSGRNQDNGNRIDNRSRGNAAQLLEKYKTLARDAQQSGDRVLTEYYLQFADHYFRVLADTRARFEENQPRREGGQDREEQGYEGEEGFESDDGDEFDPRPQSRVQSPQPPRYEREPQETRERSDSNRDQEGNENRPRRDYGDRPRNNYNGNGADRAPRDDYRQERPQRDDRPREDRPREDRPREERQAREDRPARDDRPRQPRVERAEPAEASTLSLDMLPPAIAVTPLADVEDAPVVKKPRGRPKKVVGEVAADG